jgi:hypothetical protein
VLGMVAHTGIPATWEAEVGGSWFEASPGNSSRLHWEDKLKKQKDWGHDSTIGPEFNPQYWKKKL